MTKKMKRSIVLMILVEIIFLGALGSFLVNMQTNVSVSEQKEHIKENLDSMEEILADADAEAVQATASFDEVNQAKAGSLAFMFQNGVMEEYSAANMQEAKALLSVDNVLVVDKEGNVLAKAQDSPTDFTYSRFNQLRTTFETGESSEGFEVKTGEERFRYYGHRIDDEAMVVIEQNPAELDELLAQTSTWDSVLGNISVGLEGYAFAISAKDYTFLDYPDEKLIGQDALSNGVDADDLEKDHYTWLTIDGQKLYCGITKVDDAYILCAVTADEILASRNTTVGIILFAFFAVLTLVITYAFFIMFKEENEEKVSVGGGFYYNRTIGHKIGTISFVGVICILLISFYMQSLFSLSRQSMTNNQRVKEVEREIKFYGKQGDELAEQYSERYLNKCQIAAYIIDQKPELGNRESLAEMCNILGIEYINIFDQAGVQTATNSPYTRFTVSQDPEDQSYDFNKLLLGKEYLIQEARADDVTGDYHQYIGVTLRDAEQNPDGFVQIAVAPEMLKETLENMQIENILSGIRVGQSGKVFAVDKKDNKFVYYPEEKMIGRSASKYGIKKAQLMDEFSGYMEVSNEKLYASCLETDDYYVYAAVPTDAMSSDKLPITIASVVASIIALAIVFLLLTISRKGPETEEEKDGVEDGPMIDVDMPDGTRRKTTSAKSRWSNKVIHWDEKTAEQQIFLIFKSLVALLAIFICVNVIFIDQLDSNSIFRYVIEGKWPRGVNIFALTGSVMILCVGSVITIVIQKILQILSRTFGAKGETICRLLRSFVKYMSVLAILYYCLALFGVDTKTLLASAGILTLVVGLGAQTLVSDILAGLFIIFEGDFQVGDIVTIGDCCGTVMEIGIRTTKIMDGSQNIKVISNSSVSGVINMTRDYSFAWCDVGIEYGESLERVENILQQEFPRMREEIPGIIDGPFYKGVIALGDNSVTLRVMVLCAESARGQMVRDLNREMKLIFDKYNINIPFPQVVINKPTEFKKATWEEKRQAEEFHKEQRELSGAYIEDDEDDN